MLRKIGHELLLQSGDSTSRVLPIENRGKNEYRIKFENEFAFKPELLVTTTQRLLANAPQASNYVVNVINCGNGSVAYGYAISENKKDDIITCKGRKQPKSCYIISIKFKPTGISAITSGYLLGGLPLLAFVGFVFVRSVKPRNVLPNNQETDLIAIGSVLFDTKNKRLQINNETTELTGTETRVLGIFALSPNQTVQRVRLQKEIWEDEGVIVGRSLDMFISKLRKKLEAANDVNIVVVRGKGYKLEVKA